MKKDSVYAGFKVIDVVDLTELGATGIWLKHETTGMEVYHVLNNDEENLFSFTFKTPPSDSTGVAHILEHSVLCGSKNFPLKDPFLQLSNQSVKTFLNAMTFPDKTVYPASSMVEADYFNLMAVYGDAVFFPLLHKWTFDQEAHRLEKDPGGKVSIQGVVYNEMKGNYSSPDSVAADWCLRSILPNTVYDLDSGGDPEFIPDLTYEQFKQFHADFYNPSNCRVFLCGNIPTEKQIDFLHERFMQHFSKQGSVAPDIALAKPFEQPVTMEVAAPVSTEEDESGSSVLVNWLLGDASDPVEAMEASFFSEILLGHDASPLTHALVESGLGEDISPNSGVDTEIRQLCFSVGLRGVEKKDATKVEQVIFDVLNKIAKEGVPAEELEAATMSIDFSIREVRRSGGGPFSLTLMRRCLKGWLHGKRPDATFWSRKTFNIIKEKAENPQYIQELCKRLLLENTHRSLLTVFPDKDYEKNAKLKEEAKIESLLKIRQPILAEDFTRMISGEESEENTSLIPHLRPQDLCATVDRIITETTSLHDVPIYTNTENTNGITYVDVGLPLDVLPPEDFAFLPTYSSLVTSVGYGGMSWAEASAYEARICGGFGSTIITMSHAQQDKEGRSWLLLRLKMLEEQCEKAIAMLFSCLESADFSDKKRLKDILLENRNDLDSSVIPGGHQYASSLAVKTFSRSKAIDEIWHGLSQLDTAQKLAAAKPEKIIAECERIHSTLINSGCIVHITAQKQGIERVIKTLDEPLKKFCSPKPAYTALDSDFIALTKNAKTTTKDGVELFSAPTQVGFAASCVRAHSVQDENSVYERILGHWLSNSLLWQEIRTVGGAYGAFSHTNTLEKVFTFATYRDPNPRRSLEVFVSCLKTAAETVLDNDSFEKAITGTYSKEVQPSAPSSRGFTGFMRTLYGVNDELRERNMQLLLNAKPEDVQAVAKILYEQMKENATKALVANS